MNELSILKKLDHPDVIRLYEWFEDDDFVYLVTEYFWKLCSFCEGGEFFDYLEKKCCLSEEEARAIFIQILGVVKYIHSKKIAHRDLKPENFLLLKKTELN
jgi:calcium-dependent protein kinase